MIKGVIAHEICHYVMRLVYQNNENPYYKDDDEDCQRLNAIVAAIELLLFPQEKLEEKDEVEEENHADEEENQDIQQAEINDECAGIISTVYTCYDRKDFHPELIVRPIHIYAQFDNDEDYTSYLVEKYKILFEYFEQVVIPELEKFNLKQRERVKKFNEFVGALCKIENLNYELTHLKDITSLIDSHIIIITTNVPKLLLHNIYKHLDQIRKNLLEDQNIFITPDILKNSFIVKEFKEIVSQKIDINIFIDCSKGINSKIKSLIINESSNFIFLVSNGQYKNDLANIFKVNKLQAQEKTVNYEWNDLAIKTRCDLIQRKINFQNKSTLSLFDLLSNQNNVLDQDQSFEEFSSLVDEELISLLINEEKISINTGTEKDVDVLYQPRNFIRNNQIYILDESVESSIQKYSEEQMLHEVLNQKYFFISDFAGVGKTETVKNMLVKICDNYTNYWVAYIDLRQYSNYLKSNEDSVEILRFFNESVLKEHTKFEKNIFNKLYSIGKVCLIFDELDKIHSTYHKIAVKLFKSFDSSHGNSFWIVTRDYCESDLKESLKLEVTYKLDDFAENHGIELIASYWVLDEIDVNFNKHSKGDIINQIKSSPNFPKYLECARIIVNKCLALGSHSFGCKLPHFYKIIAEIFKNDKDCQTEFSILKLYAEYVKIQYEKWLLKCSENLRILNKQSKYYKVHQLIAMQILFSEDLNNFGIDELGWTDEEIIECGFIGKIENNFVFHYEIFQDFFIVDYIVRILKKNGNKIADDFCLNFIKILFMPKFKAVRMFLNEAFIDKTVLKCIDRKMESLAKNLIEHHDQFVNLSQILEENYEHLTDFLISIFQKGSSEIIRNILGNNITIYGLNNNSSKSIIKFQEFLNSFLNFDNLLSLIKIVILKNSNSSLDIGPVKIFMKSLESTKGLQFIKKALYFNDLNMFISSRDDKPEKIIHYLLVSKNEPLFEFTLKKMKELLTREQSQEILKSKGSLERNLLHKAVGHSSNIEIHNIIWNFYRELFNNKEILDILKNVDTNGENMLTIAANSTTTEILAFYIEEVEKISSYKEIKLNFMTTELLSEIERNHLEFFKSELIQKYLSADDKGNNKLNIEDSTQERLNSEKLNNANTDVVWCVIKKFFICENFPQQFGRMARIESSEKLVSAYKNLDELANNLDKIEFHEILWELFLTIFNREELLNLLICKNESDNNFIHLIIAKWTFDKIKFTFNQIKENFNDDQLLEILRVKGPYDRNIIQTALCESKNIEVFKLIWETVRDSCKTFKIFLEVLIVTNSDGNNLFHLAAYFTSSEIIEFILQQLENNLLFDEIKNLLTRYGFECKSMLRAAAEKNTDIQLHKMLWKIMRKYFNSSEILKFIKCTDELGNNFFLQAVYFNTKAVVEISLEEIENSLGFKMNEYLMDVNNKGNNILMTSAYSKNEEKLEFICTLLKKYLAPSELQRLAIQTNSAKRSILHIASINPSLNYHIILWTFLVTLFEKQEEFYSFLSVKNENDYNFLHTLIINVQNEEVIEFVLNQMHNILSDIQFKKIVKEKGKEDKNLLHLACKSPNIHKQRLLWNTFQDICKSNNEFIEILKEVDINGHNVIQCAARFSISISFDYFMGELEFALFNKEIKNILSKVDNEKRNILQIAATYNLSRQLNDLLFEVIKKHFDTDELVEMMTNVDKCGNNLLFNLVSYNKCDTVKSLWYDIKGNFFKSGESFLKYLNSKNNAGDNILHTLMKTKNFTMLQFLWVEIEATFKNLASWHQFRELINEKSSNNLNVIHLAAMSDNIKFLETFWDLLLESFGSLEEIESSLIQEEGVENNFLDIFMGVDKTDSVLLKMVNLLQNIASKTKSPERYKLLWVASRKLCKNDEKFVEFLQDQKLLCNAFNNILNFKNVNSIEFAINEMQEILTENKIRDILRQRDHKSQNLLQQSVVFRKPLEFYSFVWKIFLEYFKPNEIIDIINNNDDSNDNLLFDSIRCKNKEIIAHTWSQIKNILKSNENRNAKFIIQRKDKNILHYLINSKDENILLYLWKELKENCSELFNVNFNDLFHETILNDNRNVLQLTVFCSQIEFHESFWALLLDTFDDKDDLLNLICQKDNNDNNFVHLLIMYTKFKIIEFIFSIIINNISQKGYRKIIQSKGVCKKNLLQLAVSYSNELEIIQFIFELFKRFQLQAEPLLLIEADMQAEHILGTVGTVVDLQNNNIFHLAMCFSTSAIFAFLLKEFQKSTSNDNLRVILNILGFSKQNLLQKAVIHNTSLEFHKYLWSVLVELLNPSDILEMIYHLDEYGQNLILNAVKWNSKEIVELTWSNVKKFIIKREDQSEYLKSIGYLDKNLQDFAFENQIDAISMRVCVQNLLLEYKND